LIAHIKKVIHGTSLFFTNNVLCALSTNREKFHEILFNAFKKCSAKKNEKIRFKAKIAEFSETGNE